MPRGRAQAPVAESTESAAGAGAGTGAGTTFAADSGAHSPGAHDSWPLESGAGASISGLAFLPARVNDDVNGAGAGTGRTRRTLLSQSPFPRVMFAVR